MVTGNRQHVKCKHCPWETAHPKAFRMRAHVFACTNMPEAERTQFKALLDSLPTNEGTLNGEGQMGLDGAMEGVEREVGVEGSNANGGPKNKQVKRAKPYVVPVRLGCSPRLQETSSRSGNPSQVSHHLSRYEHPTRQSV